MPDSVIIKRLNNKISKIQSDENSIMVLKGIPLEFMDEENSKKISLKEIAPNKAAYLFTKVIGKRRVITYEEFLMLNSIIIDQYKDIYILNNNIYIEQYPIKAYFDNEIRKGLLKHFEDIDYEDDESYIGDIAEYISLYNGLKEYNGTLIGTYCDEKVMLSTKIKRIDIFDDIECEIAVSSKETGDFVDIIEEADYIDVIKSIFQKPKEVRVRITNYCGDKYKLKEHMKLLAYYWQDWTDIYYVQPQKAKRDFEHRKEYSDLLKQYWGYDEFRALPIYDMSKLENGEKEVVYVSQENIISNLVKEVENCADDNKDFRDLFVTAPTGAGKSVMFQIPAIYLAEKYNLLTIVISPLIGLMNDQIKNLEVKNYRYAKTINSDISPIVKQDIIEKVADGNFHILYISPETLLSRSDVEQLIGKRTIGMIVIDEAHIVTTWGKQFRPDYWYLGDHIKKLRKKQLQDSDKKRSFVVATFTATTIYHGIEDMYTETINSLHMLQPITYLGYVKRKDINIVIDRSKKEKGERLEYEFDKFEQLENVIKRAIVTNKKTLIYFPTVALINRFYEFLRLRKMIARVALYHGSLPKDQKLENYEAFLAKEKLVMLATKAFGMGIDIDDIELVVHFAPTGNVCDYVQEIGRAARRKDLEGEAYYHYNKKDFKHINRLHGLSAIQRYQLIEVIKKINDLYQTSIQKNSIGRYTRKRNAMLLDAENFAYIFGTPISDEGDNINKVKTALLIIQKDFEGKIGFSPINVRPIPLFSLGFFKVDTDVQNSILKKYPGAVEEIEKKKHICRIYLDKIWHKSFTKYSFPQFKFMLYSNDSELEFVKDYTIRPALCISVEFDNDFKSTFYRLWEKIKSFIHKKVLSSEHTAVDEIADMLTVTCNIGKYKARAICEVVIASMDSYRKNFTKSTAPIAIEKTTTDGFTKYQFNVAVNNYFQWVESGFKNIISATENGELYLINDNGNKIKEYSVVLGILEALDVLSFKMLGGANSQIYIYINQIQSLKNILYAPYNYKNRLLDMVAERHLISVEMLTYIYENDFKSEDIWDLVENYFLGIIPEKVQKACLKKNPNIII